MEMNTEKIYKGAKARLYPNPNQTKILESILFFQRTIYNTAVSLVKEKKIINKAHLLEELKAKGVLNQMKEEIPMVNQEILFDEVFKDFLSCLKKCQLKNKEIHFLSFFDRKQSLVLGSIDKYPLLSRKSDNQESNSLVIKNLGVIKYRGLRSFKGKYFHIRIYRESGGRFYFSCGTIESHERIIPPSKTPVGIDLGLENFVVTSDGEIIKNPHAYKRMLKHLAHLQRFYEKKQKGSKNRGKLRTKIAIIYKKIDNIKEYVIHKLTKVLVQKHSFISMESLDFNDMKKTRLFSRSFFDASLSKIKNALSYKCAWNKIPLVFVDRLFPSSQICHVCGHKSSITKDPFVHEWDCPHCHSHLNRDINAAVNIRNEGIRLYCLEKKKTIPDKYQT